MDGILCGDMHVCGFFCGQTNEQQQQQHTTKKRTPSKWTETQKNIKNRTIQISYALRIWLLDHISGVKQPNGGDNAKEWTFFLSTSVFVYQQWRCHLWCKFLILVRLIFSLSKIWGKKGNRTNNHFGCQHGYNRSPFNLYWCLCCPHIIFHLFHSSSVALFQ